jgi:hypothetical protein
VEDFCYITDNTYTRTELVAMESDILRLLDFEIGSPTIKTFLRWHAHPKVRNLFSYSESVPN